MNKLILLILLPLLLSFAGAVDSFGVNSVLIKISLHQGETVVKTVTVSAITSGSFEASVEELSGVTLSSTRFSLNPSESKDLVLNVDGNTLEPGVYVGHILLKNTQEELKIPIVIEVESPDVFFDLNLDIPPQYSEVAPGSRFIVEIKIFDLTGFKAAGSLGPSPVTLNYELRGINGEILSIETENVIVDKQAQITKTFILPSTLREGDYFFTATARHKTSLGSASSFLAVRSPLLSSSSLFTPEFIVLLVAFAIFFLIIVAFIVYLVRDRNKLFAELYHYNASEFKRHEALLGEQAKVLEQRGMERGKIQKEVNARLGKLKLSQEKRVEQLKKLEQKGNAKEMQRKLKLWKKEGYSTIGLEHKLTGLSQKDMKRIMSGWKKQYKTEDYKNR